MKRIILIAFAIHFSIALFAQNVTVTDKLTGENISNVIISCKDKITQTDNNGKVDISIFKMSDTLIFNRYNYKTAYFSVNKIIEMNYKVLLTESSVNIDEILISANKWEQKSKEIPYLIQNISKSKIELWNPQTSADMLNYTGKIFVQKSQLGGGSPMIRGFAANRVLIVVDGVRMNNAIFRSGNLQNVISIDPNAIENSEVIFGPGSMIYGSDALGGVMDFHTKSPSFSNNGKTDFFGNTFFRTSSANSEKTAHLDFNFGFKNIALLTSISYSNFGDLKMGNVGNAEYIRPEYVDRINDNDTIVKNQDPNLQVFSGYSQINIMQKIKLNINKNIELNYGFHYANTSNIPRYDRLIAYKNNILRYAEWNYGPQFWLMNNLNFSVKSETKIFNKIKITLAQQSFEESRINRSIYDEIRNIKTDNVEVYSLNADFEKYINIKSNLFYGFESVYNLVNSTGETENIVTPEILPDASRYPDGSVMTSNSVYMGYKNNISKKFTFTSGLRYSHIYLNADFDNTYYDFPFTNITQNNDNVTGSFGLVFRPSNTWQINTHISSGFRAPNIDDIGKVFDSEPGNVIVPNPDLKPEYAYNFDLGTIKTLSDFARIELTLFYNYLDNAILRGDFNLNGEDSIMYEGTLSKVEALVNNDFAYVYGFETSAAFDISKNFELKLNFNKEFGRTKDGLPVRHVAPTFGSVYFTYKCKKIRSEIYGIYNGEISNENLAPDEQNKPYMYATDENGLPYSPKWLTLNFRSSVSVTKNLIFNFSIENITNERYRPYSSGITAAGRNFIFSLRLKF